MQIILNLLNDFIQLCIVIQNCGQNRPWWIDLCLIFMAAAKVAECPLLRMPPPLSTYGSGEAGRRR